MQLMQAIDTTDTVNYFSPGLDSFTITDTTPNRLIMELCDPYRWNAATIGNRNYTKARMAFIPAWKRKIKTQNITTSLLSILLYDKVNIPDDELPLEDSLIAVLTDYQEELSQMTNYSLSKEKQSLISELHAIGEECGEVDWDGEGACAITDSTLEIAKHFIEVFPEDMPLPEISPDADGDISFDWYWGKGKAVSASINSDGRISFAWLDLPDRGHGVVWFENNICPKRLIVTINGFEG